MFLSMMIELLMSMLMVSMSLSIVSMLSEKFRMNMIVSVLMSEMGMVML